MEMEGSVEYSEYASLENAVARAGWCRASSSKKQPVESRKIPLFHKYPFLTYSAAVASSGFSRN